jgi:hypothetical protein
MVENNEVPFPQADDFEKVIALLNVEDEGKFQDKKALGILLGEITDRQVQYYLSACQYLGLITADKHFTDLGDRIRSLGETQKMVELAILIVSKDIFGTVYFSEKSLGQKYTREEIIEIMHDHDLGFEKDEMFKRRAQTVLKWVQWINDNFDQNN